MIPVLLFLHVYIEWWAPAKEISAALTLALIHQNFSGASANVHLQNF